MRRSVDQHKTAVTLFVLSALFAALCAVLLSVLSADTAVVVAVIGAVVATYFAAAQLWTSIIIGQAETERESARETRRKARFDRLKAKATYEAGHNLQHFAAHAEGKLLDRAKCQTAERPQIWPGWPDFTTLQARRLLDDTFEDLFPPGSAGERLWAEIDHLVRNDEYLARFAFTPQGLAQAEEPLAYFVEYCVRILIDAGRESKRGQQFIRSLPGRC
jgi:hypothetical protein